MAKTAAEKQRDYRQRHARLMVALKAENTDLRDTLERALAENELLRTEIERLSGPQCQHPSHLVEAGHCHGCGTDDLW